MELLPVLGTVVLVALGWPLSWIAFTHRRYVNFHRREGRSYPPLGVAGWTVFYLRTLGSILRLAAWMVRAWGAEGLRVPAGELSGGPVLCVHGFHMTATSTWGHRRTLEARGRPTRAVFLGLPYRNQEVYGRSLRRVLRALREERPGEPVDVVAHSMGGLILRLVLAREPELAAGVRRIVTLGTPHHGTALLRWFRSGPVYRMMSRESKFLRELPDFAHSTPQAEVLTVATAHDLVVYPVETAYLPGAHQVTLEGIGHVGMLTEREVRDRVADWLQR
jgi:pimeloyl-ACP methyl ester carboxylesterase